MEQRPSWDHQDPYANLYENTSKIENNNPDDHLRSILMVYCKDIKYENIMDKDPFFYDRFDAYIRMIRSKKAVFLMTLLLSSFVLSIFSTNIISLLIISLFFGTVNYIHSSSQFYKLDTMCSDKLEKHAATKLKYDIVWRDNSGLRPLTYFSYFLIILMPLIALFYSPQTLKQESLVVLHYVEPVAAWFAQKIMHLIGVKYEYQMNFTYAFYTFLTSAIVIALSMVRSAMVVSKKLNSFQTSYENSHLQQNSEKTSAIRSLQEYEE